MFLFLFNHPIIATPDYSCIHNTYNISLDVLNHDFPNKIKQYLFSYKNKN